VVVEHGTGEQLHKKKRPEDELGLISEREARLSKRRPREEGSEPRIRKRCNRGAEKESSSLGLKKKKRSNEHKNKTHRKLPSFWGRAK